MGGDQNKSLNRLRSRGISPSERPRRPRRRLRRTARLLALPPRLLPRAREAGPPPWGRTSHPLPGKASVPRRRLRLPKRRPARACQRDARGGFGPRSPQPDARTPVGAESGIAPIRRSPGTRRMVSGTRRRVPEREPSRGSASGGRPNPDGRVARPAPAAPAGPGWRRAAFPFSNGYQAHVRAFTGCPPPPRVNAWPQIFPRATGATPAIVPAS